MHVGDLEPLLIRMYGELPRGVKLQKLHGDASSRTYYRLRVPGAAEGVPESAVVMRLPQDPFRSEEVSSEERQEELPFLNIHRMLSDRGIPVPRVYLSDVGAGFIILEDLGDETFEARLAAEPVSAQAELYGAAVDLLAELHNACDSRDARCVAYGRTFSEDLLRAELDQFREWGIEALYGPMDLEERHRLDRCFDALATELSEEPVGFVHRDYQSRNLMWASGGGPDSLVLLDFQDALIGPRPYDLVSLLCDSYVAVDYDLQRRMVGRYLSRRRLPEAEVQNFAESFWKTAIQRKLKDAGRFVYIDRSRGNSAFLRWYAPSFVYVGRALASLTQYRELAGVLSRTIPGFPDRVGTPAARDDDP